MYTNTVYGEGKCVLFGEVSLIPTCIITDDSLYSLRMIREVLCDIGSTYVLGAEGGEVKYSVPTTCVQSMLSTSAHVITTRHQPHRDHGNLLHNNEIHVLLWRVLFMH